LMISEGSVMFRSEPPGLLDPGHGRRGACRGMLTLPPPLERNKKPRASVTDSPEPQYPADGDVEFEDAVAQAGADEKDIGAEPGARFRSAAAVNAARASAAFAAAGADGALGAPPT